MLKFRSNGKFLLSGEYLVLKGALALAMPLKFGQTLEIESFENKRPLLFWKTYTLDKPWFKVVFELPNLNIIETNDPNKAQRLRLILAVLQTMNPDLFFKNTEYQVNTNLEFDTEWGLGSSSTLVSNLATWAQVDAFELLRNTFGGSGYDVACAIINTPILYQLIDNQPDINNVSFNPVFSNKLYFVYTGHKKDSSSGVKNFNQLAKNQSFEKEIAQISDISKQLVTTSNFDEFCRLMRCHEQITSDCIQKNPVKSQFADFEGDLKSLGAWEGDFILAMSELPEQEVKTYFNQKGLKIIFKFDELKYPL